MADRKPLHEQEQESNQSSSGYTEESERNIADIQKQMQKVIEDDRRKAMKLEGDVEDEEDNYEDKTLSKESKSPDRTTSSEDSGESSKYSRVELDAISKGWKPKDKFAGDPDHFITAAEFLKNTNLYDEISSLRTKLKKQDKAMEAMNSLLIKRDERELKERIDYYEPQVKAAKESGNIDEYETWKRRFEESKKALDDLQKSKEQEIPDEKSNEKQSIAPEVKNFVVRNSSWLNSKNPEDRAMRQFAISEEIRIKEENPNASWSEIVNEIEKSVKSVFSHRFENQNRSKPASVAVSNQQGKIPQPKTKYNFRDDCPKEYRAAVRECAVKFNMTLDEYTTKLYESNILHK